MKRQLLAAVLLLIAAAPVAAPNAALAQPEGHARQVSLSRVLQLIAQHTPGRQLNTTMGDQGGRPVYFVQWQKSDGRVVVFVVDAETGQILGQQGG